MVIANLLLTVPLNEIQRRFVRYESMPSNRQSICSRVWVNQLPVTRRILSNADIRSWKFNTWLSIEIQVRKCNGMTLYLSQDRHCGHSCMQILPTRLSSSLCNRATKSWATLTATFKSCSVIGYGLDPHRLLLSSFSEKIKLVNI